MPKLVSVSLVAGAAGWVSGHRQAAGASRDLATTVQVSSRRQVSAMGATTAAAQKMVRAERAAADAASDVRIAETRLEAVRAKGNATALQRIKAEEALAKASRRLAAVQTEVQRTQPSGARGYLARLETEAAAVDRVSGSMLRAGTVAALSLGATGKAAMAWQSDWAGVTKTVDGSAAQMDVLEGELRSLTKVLPATHHEIAAVAEAAGQLGIQRTSVSAFTKTVIDLGETTNLTADEAATSLAQFSNIMGTLEGPPDQVNTKISRLGSTVVDLGNKGASTERDIVQMGLRIAGAGRQIGLTETQVLGYASALSSVGVEVEAGGTAISTTMLKVEQLVRSGGPGLETLAQVAGMSGREFKQAFEQDAGRALATFIAGLGRVQQQGGNTTAILKDLGVTGIRESDSIRRLASSGDLLTKSLGTADAAWRSNSALVQEAAKRYATAESQAKMAWNTIKDEAIDAGTSMLPVAAQIATAVSTVVEVVGELPEPVRIAGVSIAGTVAIMGLAGGGALRLGSNLLELRTAWRSAEIASTTAGRAMKIATLSIPVVGVALFALSTVMQVLAKRQTDATQTANTFDQAMQSVEGSVTRATAAMNENVRTAAVQALQQKGIYDQAQRLGLSYGVVTDAALGNKEAIAQVNEVLAASLALNPQLSQGNADAYNAAVALSQGLIGVARESISAVEAEQQRRAAMNDSTGATDEARTATANLTTAQEDLRAAQKRVRDETQKVIDKFTILRDGALSQERANQAWQESLDAVAESVKRNGTTLDQDTSKGRSNRDAITGMITALNDKVTADFKANVATKGVTEATRIANEQIKTGRARILESADAAGINTDKVKGMQDRMLKTPKQLKTEVDTPGLEKATDDVKGFKSRVDELRDKKIKIEAEIALEESKAVAAAIRKSNVGTTGAQGGNPVLPKQKKAGGGAIHGPGTPTSDSILGIDAATGLATAMVSTEEFVTNARQYKKNKRQVETINAGGEWDLVPRLANGGQPVSRRITVDTSSAAPDYSLLTSAVDAATDRATDAATAYAKEFSDAYVRALNKKLAAAGSGPIGGGSYAGALSWFRTQDAAGYRMGAVGPGLYDCSGAMSAIANYIEGKPLHSRRFSTGQAAGGPDRVGGFTRDKMSPFRIGIIPTAGGKIGHTAGTLNGVNVESRGGAGVVIGPRARGWDHPLFRYHYGLAGGGAVGDPPFDTVSRFGKAYDPRAAEMLAMILQQVRGAKYDNGGMLQPGLTLAHNATGKPEAVLTTGQWGTLRQLAGGGPVKASAFGTSTTFSVAQIVALIRAVEVPLRDLATLTRRVAAARADYAAARRTLTAPQARLDRASRTYSGAREEQIEARERVAALRKVASLREGQRRAELKDAREDAARLRKAGGAAYARAKARVDDLENPTKAARRLKKAQQELTEANNAVARSSKAKQDAQAAYDRVAAKAKVAADRLKEAQQELAEQQRQVAESARSMSEQFRDAYTSQSTDVNDWLQAMLEGKGDLSTFNRQIQALRKAGLSEMLIQEIIGRGAVAGGDVAAQILAGGKALVASLNQANQGIQDAADRLGYTGSIGPARHAFGGSVSRWVGGFGGPTQDNQIIRASASELVVNATDAKAVREGRMVIDRNYVQGHRYAGTAAAYAAVGGGSSDQSTQITVMGDVIDPDRILRRADARRRDALTMRGLSGRRT